MRSWKHFCNGYIRSTLDFVHSDQALAESGPQISWNSLLLTSALPPEADIKLISVKGSANDPKRT